MAVKDGLAGAGGVGERDVGVVLRRGVLAEPFAERVKGSSPEKGENLTFVPGETEDDRLKSHFFDPIQTQIPIQFMQEPIL